MLARSLAPLIRALAGSDDSIIAHFEKLGWLLPEVPPALKGLQGAGNQVSGSLAKLEQALRRAEDGAASDSDLEQPAADLPLAVAALGAGIRGLPTELRNQLSPAFIAATQIDEQIQRRLFDDALSRQLEYESNQVFVVARALGLVETIPHDADGAHFQPAFEQRVIRWDRLLAIANGPAALMRDVYGWGTPTLESAKLLLALRDLCHVLLLRGFFDYAPRPLLHALDPALPDNVPRARGLLVPVLQGTPLQVFLGLYPLPKKQPDELQGLVAILTGLASVQQFIQLTPAVSLNIDSQIDLTSGMGVGVWPDRAPKILGNLATAPAQLIQAGSAKATLTYAPTDENERTVLLSLAGLNVDSRGFALAARFAMGADGTIDFRVEGNLAKLRAQLGGLGQDSFLGRVLPGRVTVESDLAGGWSAADGFYWNGNTGSEFSIPVNQQIGPVQLNQLSVSFASADGKFQVGLGVSASFSIGPVLAEVEGVGIAVAVDTQGGNLGPIDLGLSPLAPKGVGLSVDAAGVTGGGFLRHEPAKREYAGMLQLQFIDLEMQAFGLITTAVAGGAGYSLLAMVDAEFPPIQLGWGFTLEGVGGLLAVHRTASTDALHAALKAGQLSSVLFPKNAMTNAPAILAQLDALFPTAPGRFLFGPMALIGWGKPRMLKAAIAVVVELPEPIRVILLARIEARLPNEDNPLVRINMDALGVLDLGKSELSFDALLFDSKLVDFTMSGAMALRATWASPSHRSFLLAIGGVHPRFTPPSGFPELQRIVIDMPSGRISKLRLAAYLARSSNSLQLGANLDFFLGVSGFGVAGHLGFDALLQIRPFRFDAFISGKVAITAGGDDLASVHLEGAFSGPKPYHLAGQFNIHLVFFDVGVSFNYSWGGDLLSLPELLIDVAGLLTTELADVRNWDALLPPGVSPLVSARRIDNTALLLAHPLARPQVHQRTVPLGLAITRFGEAVPSGANMFRITALRVGRGAIAHEPIQDDFAPAQFFALTDDEKLERPSFERHDAGARAARGDVTSGAPFAKTAAYETFFVDEPGGALRTDPGVVVTPPSLSDLFVVMQFGSAGRSASSSNRGRYQAAGNPIRVAEPAFVLADKSTMDESDVGRAAATTFSDMHALLGGRRNLQIVGSHEITAN